MLVTAGMAQLNGTYNIPGSYPDLASAIADLNLQGVSGPVTFSIAAGYTETAPIGGYTITATGTSANTIQFIASGGATITAYTGGTGTPSSATTQDFVFRLIGSDYITFNGLTILENPSNSGNALMEAGFAFLKASATDGCQYNTIQNCFIKLSYQNNASGSGPSLEGSKGIFYTNATNTALTTNLTITNASGSNSFNSIISNTIANTNYGIALVGYADASPYANADYNNTIQSNVIYNFGGATGATNPAAGIRTQNQYNITIANNILVNNNPLDPGAYHTNTLRGIYLQGANNANVTVTSNTLSVISGATTSQLSIIENASGGSGTNNLVNISNNYISNSGYTPAGTSGTFYGIYNNAVSTFSISVNNNTITNCSSSASGSFNFIYISGTSSNASALNTINNNAITNNSLTTTGSVYFIYNSNSTPNSIAIGNAVTNFTKTGSGGTVYGYYNFGSPTGGTALLQNNLFNQINLTGTSTFYGLNHFTASSQTLTVKSNTITNITGGSGTTYVIRNYYMNDCSNNLINNITAFGSVEVLDILGAYSFPCNAYNNLISNITTTSTTVYGIYSTASTLNLYANKVTNLSSTSTATNVIVNGIYLGSTTANVYNNIVGDLLAPAASATNAINGININAGTTSNIINNTIRISASSTGANFGTSGIYASTTPTLLLQNNIIINTSTPAGTGKTVAYRRSGTTLSTYSNSSNKNIFYAGTPGPQNLIFSDGTNDHQTLSTYKTFVSPADAGSYTENTTFLSTNPSNLNYLHVDGSVSSLSESNALTVPTVSVDIDGDIRQGFPGYTGTGTSPDIGADEYNGIFAGFPNDVGVNAITNPISTGCYSSAENVIVSVKNYGTNDQSNIPVEVWVSGPTPATISTVYTNTITSGASATVNVGTINMTSAGSYTIKAFTGLSGDGDPTNDTMVIVRNVAPTFTLPQYVPFTGFNGSNLPTVYPGWYEAQGTVPTGTTSLWTNQTGVGTSTNVTARVNLYTNNRKEWIVGPKIVPTASTVLKFDAAVTDWTSTNAPDVMGSDDQVLVMVSTDCGISFAPIYTISAANNLPPSLTPFIVPLTSYSNSPIIVAFYATDGTVDDPEDYDFHLDNINIYDAPGDDLAANAIIAPNTAANCLGTEQVNVSITNNGSNAATNFTVEAILSGANTGTISTVYTNTLNGFGTTTLNVGSFNMSNTGSYTIVVNILYPSDSDLSNNSITATYSNVVLPFPMLETFDAVSPLPGLPAGWVSDNGSASYDFTVRVTGSSIPHGAGNPPTQGITANLWSGNTTSWFETPSIGSLQSNDVVLSFVYRIVNYAGYANPGGTATSYSNNDSLKVYVSSNCGNTWNLIGFINGANHTVSNTFAKKSFCLGNSYAGQNVKLRFEAKWSTGDYWFDIDSVSLDVMNVNVSNSSIVACQNDNITVTASGANTYTWNPGGLVASTFTVPTNTAGASTYTVTGEISGCFASATIQTTVNPTPTISVNSATICSGQSATLTASGATSYTWNTSATSNSIVVNPSITTAYGVIGESLGCSNTATTQVVVNSLPIVSSSVTNATTPGCNNGSATLTVSGNGPFTYSWSAPASSTTNVATNLNGTSGTGTSYTVTVTDANGCSSVSTFTVDCVTSISSINGGGILSVYPNPNNGSFIISSGSNVTKLVKIMDITGRVVKEINTSEKEIMVNMMNFARGTYIIEVMSEEGISRVSIIKE